MKKRFFGAAILAAFFLLPTAAEASPRLRRDLTAGAQAHCRTIMTGGGWTDGMRASQRTSFNRWYAPSNQEYRGKLARLLYKRINEMCPEAEAVAYRRWRQNNGQQTTPTRTTYGETNQYDWNSPQQRTARNNRDKWVTR